MQVGTSRSSSVSGGADYLFTLQRHEYRRRVVSPRPARVHLPDELDDVDQTLSASVPARRHQMADGGEALEVALLADISGQRSK